MVGFQSDDVAECKDHTHACNDYDERQMDNDRYACEKDKQGEEVIIYCSSFCVSDYFYSVVCVYVFGKLKQGTRKSFMRQRPLTAQMYSLYLLYLGITQENCDLLQGDVDCKHQVIIFRYYRMLFMRSQNNSRIILHHYYFKFA